MSQTPAMLIRRLLLKCVLLAVTVATLSHAADWPQYRGPTYDGVSTERINKQWTGSVTNPVWLVFLTNGLTSLTVSGGRVFTQVGKDTDEDGYPDKEFCLALSATNGSVLWATEVEAQGFPLYPNGGVGTTDDGPRTTPIVENGSVYVLTSYLKLYRLNATNGTVIWSTNLVTGFGSSVIPWQNAASPVIENGLLFLNANCGANSLMAFNTTNGALVWRSRTEAMSHSTPVLATIHGVRQLIFATQSGLVSVNPATGALIWKHVYPFSHNTSIGASPAVHQDHVFLSAFYNMGSFAIQVLQTATNLLPVARWNSTSFQLQNHWSSPVCRLGAVFGSFTPDNATAQLRCINITNGATLWATNNFGRGNVMLVGTNLLILTERGDLVLAAASTNAYTEFARFQAIPGFHTDTNKCWNALALSDGQVYVRSTSFAARYDLSMPDLKLDMPQLAVASKLNLTIRTATGTPVNSNRLSSMEVRASTNVALSPLLWSKLTNALVLSNGIVRVTNVDAGLPQRFFIVSEPK